MHQRSLQADTQLLDTIKLIGIDTLQKKEITFKFLFHTKDDALNAQKELAYAGYQNGDLFYVKEIKQWFCSVIKHMPPAKMSYLHDDYVEIAKEFNGFYDGWEADVANG